MHALGFRRRGGCTTRVAPHIQQASPDRRTVVRACYLHRVFAEVDLLGWLLNHTTTPATAVDPHLVETLREAFVSWAGARSLSPMTVSPELRYAGRLENRDVEITTGVGQDEHGTPRIGPCLVFVACPELTPLVAEPMWVHAQSAVEGDAPDAMLLFLMQSSHVIARVALAVSAVCVQLVPASGPSVVERTVSDLDVVLRDLYTHRVKSGSAAPYRSG